MQTRAERRREIETETETERETEPERETKEMEKEKDGEERNEEEVEEEEEEKRKSPESVSRPVIEDVSTLDPRPPTSEDANDREMTRRRTPSPTRLPFRHTDEAMLEEGAEEEEEERRANERAVAEAVAEAAAEGDYDVGYNVSKPKIFKRDSAVSFRARPTRPNADYEDEILRFRRVYVDFLRRERDRRYQQGLKTHLSACVRFDVIKEGKTVDTPTPNFTSKSRIVLAADDVDERVEPQITAISHQLQVRGRA